MPILTPRQIDKWTTDWPDRWVTNEGWNVNRQDVQDIFDTLEHYRERDRTQRELLAEVTAPPFTAVSKRGTVEKIRIWLEEWR